MNIVSVKNLVYRVKVRNENNEVIGKRTVLDDINIDIKKGEFVAILGRNGSGKSTFAKHLNALLMGESGNVYINGQDVGAVDELWRIRKQCGMVFQNPDNQIVGVTVEEDVGFGPENLGVPTEEIWERVNDSLCKVNMEKFRKKSPNRLSGGQKQRVAIASSLAMKPECIVLDEPTAMLDPRGRQEVMEIVENLNKEQKMTIILITHHMDEAAKADRIVIIDKGKPVLQGTPRDVFMNFGEIRKLSLEIPQIMELSYRLYKKGKVSRYDILTVDEFADVFERDNIKNYNEKINKDENNEKSECRKTDIKKTELLRLKDVSCVYEKGNDMEVRALNNVSLNICTNEFVGIIGHTGSGKSTLIQVMNGLIRNSSGIVYFRGKDISQKDFDRRQLHFSVGLVFQYPESQLFEESVIKDVMFGPKNKGMDEREALESAKESLMKMGLDESYYHKSPFELSGGEMRRVAIAGVIAMKPEILILDEPAAGLDSESKGNLLESLKKMNNDNGTTIVIVSHNMEDVANYVKRLIVVNDGSIAYDDVVKNVFQNTEELKNMGLDVPVVAQAVNVLKERGYRISSQALTIEEAEDILSNV